MQAVGLTRAAITAPIVRLLEQLGAPVERLLARTGLPAWVRTNPEMLIPTRSIGRLLAEAARSERIPHLGLLAGEKARIEDLGTFGRLIRRSTTLGEALRELTVEYPRFSANGRTWLQARLDEVELCQTFKGRTGRVDDGWEQVDHYILMLMVDIVRLGAGPAWRPTEIRLQTGESDMLRNFAPFATTRVSFEQPATAITFQRTLLARPIAVPRLGIDHRLPAESLTTWRDTAPATDFVASIVQGVEMLSWDGYPDIRRTAEFMGVSVRTLQRHLAQAGLTHESLVARARFTTAAAVLEETDSKIIEIALDLGYSDHAHFTRAFGRWAGCSPQEYRRKLRQRASANPASA